MEQHRIWKRTKTDQQMYISTFDTFLELFIVFHYLIGIHSLELTYECLTVMNVIQIR